MPKEKFDRSKPHVNVGDIGGKSMNDKKLSAAPVMSSLGAIINEGDRISGTNYGSTRSGFMYEKSKPRFEFTEEEKEEISKLHGKAKKKRVAELKEKYRNG